MNVLFDTKILFSQMFCISQPEQFVATEVGILTLAFVF
jgi:hypothetical protein